MLTWISAWSGYGQTGRSVTTARPPGRPRGYRPYDGASAAAGPAAAVRAAGARGAAARGGAGGRSARTFPAWAMISAAAAVNRSPAAVTSPASGLRRSPPAQDRAAGNVRPAAAGSRPRRVSTSQAGTARIPDDVGELTDQSRRRGRRVQARRDGDAALAEVRARPGGGGPGDGVAAALGGRGQRAERPLRGPGAARRRAGQRRRGTLPGQADLGAGEHPGGTPVLQHPGAGMLAPADLPARRLPRLIGRGRARGLRSYQDRAGEPGTRILRCRGQQPHPAIRAGGAVRD